MKWISVLNFLPEKEGMYLVFNSRTNSITTELFEDNMFCCDYYTDVSFWMPLPEPPVKKELYYNASKDECDREESLGDDKNGNKNIIEITTENDCPDDTLKNIEWYIKEFSFFIIDVKIIKKKDGE